MLVYDYFEGDDLQLAGQQHDCYGRALGVIASECLRQIQSGRPLLRDPAAETRARGFDHRTLQVAHDILAAAWRHAVSASPTGEKSMESWLGWLALEVQSWTQQPRLIFACSNILDFQNSDEGYSAEDQLRICLLERFKHLAIKSGTTDRRQW
jgi:hypothetical protein